MKKIILIIFCLIFLVGCNNKDSKDEEKEKIVAELEYCSTKISNIVNRLNNINLENYEIVSNKVKISEETEEATDSKGEGEGSSTQTSSQTSEGGEGSEQNQEISVTEMQANSVLNTDTEEIDWDILRSEIEVLNEVWTILMLDLHNYNINNTDISGFGNTLNKCILSINAEDKTNTLLNMTTLYSYIPKLFTSIGAENSKQNLKNTQNYIISAYTAATLDDWTDASTNITNAENTFIGILNDLEYSKNKEYKVNKTYVLIKELQTVIQEQNKPLFFLKYKNLSESLNTLT